MLFSLIFVLGVLLLDSNYRLTVSEYTIESSHLPEAFQDYRIVQLSDLHTKQFGKDNRRLVEAVRKLSPDLIALTGDFIESPEGISVTRQLIQQLSPIAPVYFTSGNHDWASGAIRDLRKAVTESGGTYLSNEAVELSKNGESILLAGVEDPNSLADMIKPDQLLRKIAQQSPEAFVVLLAHRNDFLTRYPDLECDVIFTGHGHGGVLRLPFIGGLIGTDLDFFPEYDSGVYSGSRYRMVVSRGLGDAPVFPRFLNNPELVLVTLSQK